MEGKQLIFESVALDVLGITRADWNLAQNLMSQEPNGTSLDYLQLDRVLEDESLRDGVLSEIRNANAWYNFAIADSERNGKREIAERLSKEYARLRTDPYQL